MKPREGTMLMIVDGGAPWKFSNIAFNVYRVVEGRMKVAKPITFEFVDVDTGFNLEPTITFGHLDGAAILAELAEQLDERNVKTDNDAKLQGTMDAMKAHLKDMRTIVYNKLGLGDLPIDEPQKT